MRTFISFLTTFLFQRYIGLCGISWMVSSCWSGAQESTLCHFHHAIASIQMHKYFKELGIFSSLDHDQQDKNNFPLLPSLDDLSGPAGLLISAELHMAKMESPPSPNGNMCRDDTWVSAALTGGRQRSRVEQNLPGLHWYTGPSPELSVQPELASVPSPSEMLSAPFRTGSASCSPFSSTAFTGLSSKGSLSSWSPWLIFSWSDSSTLSPEGSSSSSSSFGWSMDRGRGFIRNTLTNSMHINQLFTDSHGIFGSGRNTNASYTTYGTLSHWVIYQLTPMDNPLIINGATGKIQHCPWNPHEIGWRGLLSHEQSQSGKTTLLSFLPSMMKGW